jgi:hypothetical protein
MGKAGEEMNKIILAVLIVTMVGCADKANYTNTDEDVKEYTRTHNATCKITSIEFQECINPGAKDYYADGEWVHVSSGCQSWATIKCSDGKVFKVK